MHNKKERPKERKEVLVMKDYLGQYYRAGCRRKQLEDRLKTICDDMNAPIGGLNYSPVNYHTPGKISQGSAAFTFRKSEIETRIEEQKKKAEEDLLKVMDMLDFLDQNSEQRMILELRYIDNLQWNEVARRAHLSRSVCFDRHTEGIETLLTFKRVRSILKEYEKERGL